jgi:hypothetical protein
MPHVRQSEGLAVSPPIGTHEWLTITVAIVSAGLLRATLNAAFMASFPPSDARTSDAGSDGRDRST